MNKVRLSFQLLFFCFLRLTPLHHLAMRGNLPMITLLLAGSFGSVDAMDIQVLLLLLMLLLLYKTCEIVIANILNLTRIYIVRVKARRRPWVESERWRRSERSAEGAEEEDHQDVRPGERFS